MEAALEGRRGLKLSVVGKFCPDKKGERGATVSNTISLLDGRLKVKLEREIEGIL